MIRKLLALSLCATFAGCTAPAVKARSVLDAFAGSRDVTSQCEEIVPDLEKAMADIADKRTSASEQEAQDIKSALAVCKARSRGQRLPASETPVPEVKESAPAPLTPDAGR